MSAEVRELAAAIRDALTVPQGADFAAMTRQDALLGTRAAHVRAAMNGLATGTTGLTETVELVSLAAEWHPVNYPVRDEQPGSGS